MRRVQGWLVSGAARDTPYLMGIIWCLGFEEAPIAGQEVPLNFGARADAVSWALVASRDSYSPGVVLLWGEHE